MPFLPPAARSYLDPLPTPLGDIVYGAARAALTQSLTGFFSGKKGIEKLADIWIPALRKLARELGLLLNDEETFLLFGMLCERLSHVDLNLDEQEAKIAKRAASVALGLRVTRDAGLTILYLRSAAKCFARYRDTISQEAMADAIVRFAREP